MVDKADCLSWIFGVFCQCWLLYFLTTRFCCFRRVLIHLSVADRDWTNDDSGLYLYHNGDMKRDVIAGEPLTCLTSWQLAAQNSLCIVADDRLCLRNQSVTWLDRNDGDELIGQEISQFGSSLLSRPAGN